VAAYAGEVACGMPRKPSIATGNETFDTPFCTMTVYGYESKSPVYHPASKR